MRKNLILYNPSSGNGASIKKKRRILKALDSYNINYDIHITKSEEDLRNLSRKSVNNYETIIGVGGDTTIKIIYEEIFNFDKRKNKIPKLAMIGTGSVNDIMKSIGMFPIERAIEAIKKGKTNFIDIGVVKTNLVNKEYYFLGSMSIGLGTSVNKFVEIFKKNHKYLSKGNLGQFIAAFLGVKNSFKKGMIPLNVDIEYDEEKINKRFSLLTVLNTSLFGKGIMLVENCSPFDGKFNCAVINTESFRETLSFYGNVKKRKDEIYSFESGKIKMKFEKPTDIQLDGDVLDNINNLEAFVKPKALQIIIP